VAQSELAKDTRILACTTATCTPSSAVIEIEKFKTSCSKPINVGDVFGGFEVTGIDSKLGGTYKNCIDVEYRYTVSNNDPANASAGVWLCDDKVAGVCQVDRKACTTDADCDLTDPTNTCGPIAADAPIPGGSGFCAVETTVACDGRTVISPTRSTCVPPVKHGAGAWRRRRRTW
jgi:hypothetical protein